MLGASGACAIVLALSGSATQTSPSSPNVLLITIDTLRADRLGSYGHGPAATPVLDALAASGVRFVDATAHATLTHPSHAAILTGRYPGHFGIRSNGMDPLPANTVTLAERLKTAGYHTGAVVGSVVLDKAFGLSQGFDRYDDEISGPATGTLATASLQRKAGEVTTAARSWIAQQQTPWFLWVHYYDPHLPYSAPARSGKAAHKDPYDAEIAYVDEQIGSLLAGIDKERTVVVVTADHGEALGQHGEPDHGFFLYDATLRVPLIIAGPGIKPSAIKEQVRSIDIAPTIAQLAGAGWEAHASSGESLQVLLDGGTRAEVPISIAESWYPRLHFGWSELRSARVGEWKYVKAPKPELYDMRVDPAETKNVVAIRGTVAARLDADLRRVTAGFSRPDQAAASPQPDAATVARLQALGYVGSFAPVTAAEATGNPRDHVAEYRQYRELFDRALQLLERKRPAAAVPVFQQILKSNVRAFEAHLYLGNAYFEMGKTDAALAEYDVASQLNPALATPHFEAAKTLAVRGETAAAIARAGRGLQIDANSFHGYYTLGVVHQRAAQWRDAYTAFGRAVELNGREPRARAALASAAMRLDSLAVAVVQYEAMIMLDYRVAIAHFNLGVIAERRGSRAEARKRYQLSLQADPAFKPAREALAKLK